MSAIRSALVTGASLVMIGGISMIGLMAVLALVALMSPLGTLVSAFTLWTGFWVSSCPYCMAFHIERIEVEHRRCDSCGRRATRIDPIGGPSWVEHHKDEVEHTCRDCAGLP